MKSPMNYNISSQTRKSFILDSVENEKGIILDIGCGIGYFSESISERNKSVSVISGDIDKASVRHASKNINAVFLIFDAQYLPFKNSVFDCIFSTEVIEHVPNSNFFLSEVSRILKDHGKFILTTESTEGILSPPLQHCHKYGFEKQEHKAFSEKELKEMLKKSNIKPIKINYSLSLFTKILLDIASIALSKSCPNFASQTDIYKIENSFLYKIWKFFFPLISLTIKIDSYISKYFKGSCIMLLCEKD